MFNNGRAKKKTKAAASAAVEAEPKERGWYTLDQMEEMFDLTRDGFAKSVRPLIPDDAIRNAGKKGMTIHGRRAINAFAAKASSEDPLMEAGGDSPSLERYRAARATWVELDLAERSKQLVKIEVVAEALRPSFQILRNMGDRLIRTYGNDAGEVVREALDEYETTAQAAIRRFQNEDGAASNDVADRPGATATPADDRPVR
jgi:hypothetical protein